MLSSVLSSRFRRLRQLKSDADGRSVCRVGAVQFIAVLGHPEHEVEALDAGCVHGRSHNLAVTANTYSHVLADETELDYAELLDRG